jgi:hypothetical protein
MSALRGSVGNNCYGSTQDISLITALAILTYDPVLARAGALPSRAKMTREQVLLGKAVTFDSNGIVFRYPGRAPKVVHHLTDYPDQCFAPALTSRLTQNNLDEGQHIT